MVADIDYRKFSNRVCNWREAGFIGIGFTVAVGIVGVILLGIYLGTGCAEGQYACQDGTCIALAKVCDGRQDCPIADDEWICAPTEFYVSFRSNMKFYPELGQNDTEASGNIRRRYHDAMNTDLKTQYPDSFVSVNVFRLRAVDERGNSTEEGNVAADSLIVFNATLDPRPNILPENLTSIIINGAQLKQYAPQIFARELESTTTGVAVVLRAPIPPAGYEESQKCRIKTVYCQNYCGADRDYYLHGSTKGCPECTCKKAAE